MSWDRFPKIGIQRIIFTIILVLSVRVCMSDCLQTEFNIPGLSTAFRARVSTDAIQFALSQQVDIAEKSVDSKNWLITDRIELEDLLCPNQIRFVTLADNNYSIPALLITGQGATINFVFVLKVSATRAPNTAKLKILFKAHYEGKEANILYGSGGKLEAITLQYVAMHEVTENVFPGHIILAKTYKWDSNKHRFIEGPYFVDKTAENKLSWLEAIMFPGSDRIGVYYRYDINTHNSIRVFNPSGILKEKVPRDLRSASKIKVISDSSGKVLSVQKINNNKCKSK